MLAHESTATCLLLIEDNRGDVRLIEHYLQAVGDPHTSNPVDIHHEETLSGGLDRLDNEEFDLVLLDLGLPDSTGLDTVTTVVHTVPEYPVVVLTGADDDELALKAVRHGAQDYLVKGTIDRELLDRSLRYAVERKRNERELRRQNDRLEEFSSIVSHDLRNPLTVAMGRIRFEAEENPSENLDHASAALERMETLISEVLALARQGATIGETSSVDLADYVYHAWQMVRSDRAALRTRSTLGTVRADPGRLRELLENLLGNAVTHGGDEVVVTVGLLPDDAGFFIEDDGPGIPDDARDEAFTAGFTTNQGGTGFGLAIVKSIADAQGWDVSVTAGETGGARFELRNVDIQTEDPVDE